MESQDGESVGLLSYLASFLFFSQSFTSSFSQNFQLAFGVALSPLYLQDGRCCAVKSIPMKTCENVVFFQTIYSKLKFNCIIVFVMTRLLKQDHTLVCCEVRTTVPPLQYKYWQKQVFWSLNFILRVKNIPQLSDRPIQSLNFHFGIKLVLCRYYTP